MPELPEVETARRGIAPHATRRTIVKAILYTDKLRQSLDPSIPGKLQGKRIDSVERRGKYLLLRAGGGGLLLHLGMTGHLSILHASSVAGPYDRMDLEFDNGMVLRFRDPRRFGTIIWVDNDPMAHPLLSSIGLEPLDEGFCGKYLLSTCRGRRRPIKSLLMDGRIVAGIGNIYANEALFRASIYPAVAAGELSEEQCSRLVDSVKEVLEDALARGVAVLTHFVGESLKAGYFELAPAVYGRKGEPCIQCGTKLEEIRLAGRSTIFCPSCQR